MFIMPFGPSGIKIELEKDTPSQFDSEALKNQLGTMGLSCGQLTKANLDGYIQQVNDQLPTGSVQSFGIKAPAEDLEPHSQEYTKPMLAPLAMRTELVAVQDAVSPLKTAAKGNWTISKSGDGYGPNLEIIQYPDHFNWLYENRDLNGFTGTIDNPPSYTGNYPNAEAIQKLFVNVCTTASATVVKGVDQDSMRATLTNAIQPLANANLTNYDVKASRVIFLVDDYNETTRVAAGIGVLFVSWHLSIRDYKRKSKDGGDTHPTVLTIKSGSVLYGDPGPLCSDYNSVLSHFKIDPSTAPGCAV
jgi:hypothetical protein